jgi:glycosyltransferase involved in cell wall biosynthesis
MRKKINLTIATNINGQGGIATVLQVLKDASFFNKTSSERLSSHSSKNKNKLSAIFTFVKSILMLCFYAVFYKVGVVHVHMSSRGSYTRKAIVVRLANFFSIKTIIHLHGSEFQEFYSNESSKRKQHIVDTFNMADKVIVLSSQWLAWVNTIVKDQNKACIVYNAVPEVVLPSKKSQQKNILFLGRLGQRKGVEDLINAFAKIATDYPNSQLQLGGDGDLTRYQTQVTSLGIADQVTFLGWVSGVTKNQCLADATVYCLPSYNEGFPMGILEAMSADVAVVASKAGGIPDAITDKKEGLLIDAGDVDALAEALVIMLADSEKRDEFSAAAKEKYQLNFSPAVIVPQLELIYQELLSKAK